jgi:hypothetical protein
MEMFSQAEKQRLDHSHPCCEAEGGKNISPSSAKLNIRKYKYHAAQCAAIGCSTRYEHMCTCRQLFTDAMSGFKVGDKSPLAATDLA